MSSSKSLLACYFGNGHSYSGTLAINRYGDLCERWDSISKIWNIPTNYPDATVADAANYCRNPDNDVKPWCFTTIFYLPTEGLGWAFCDIPQC